VRRIYLVVDLRRYYKLARYALQQPKVDDGALGLIVNGLWVRD